MKRSLSSDNREFMYLEAASMYPACRSCSVLVVLCFIVILLVTYGYRITSQQQLYQNHEVAFPPFPVPTADGGQMGSGMSVNVTGLDQDYYHLYSDAYGLWLQPSDADVYNALQEAILYLGNKYEGTSHEPHATLFGAVYTTDEEYVKRIASSLAASMTPFVLKYKLICHLVPNVTKQWRAGITIDYHSDVSFVIAANASARAYNSTRAQKLPHTSLLYEFGFDSYHHPEELNRTVQRIEKRLGYPISQLTWLADTIHVYHLSLRNHWINSRDMKDNVAKWRKVASYRMSG